MAFKVTVDGESWLTDELTLDEACALEEEIGATWHTMEPINSARHARGIIARFLARKVGLELAQARVGTMTIAQILECIGTSEDDKSATFDPKDQPPTASTPPYETQSQT
jgi:hypothetical protein